jgi:hypothetical protein
VRDVRDAGASFARAEWLRFHTCDVLAAALVPDEPQYYPFGVGPRLPSNVAGTAFAERDRTDGHCHTPSQNVMTVRTRVRSSVRTVAAADVPGHCEDSGLTRVSSRHKVIRCADVVKEVLVVSYRGVGCRFGIFVCAVGVCVTLRMGLGDRAPAAESAQAVRAVRARSVPYGTLSAVSCASRTACTAVGGSASLGPFAERWHGNHWTLQRIHEPAGAMNSALSGVSCTSSKACTAVGSYEIGAGCSMSQAPCSQLPLVQRWNGTKWSIEPTPKPAGAILTGFSGVSCTVGSACTAVGSWQTGPGCSEPQSNAPCSSLGLVERWNGRKWSIQRNAKPAGGSQLTGVACTSTRGCTAVGSLVERWNGSRWSIQPTPPTQAARPLSG